jgi:hypothetical protein
MGCIVFAFVSASAQRNSSTFANLKIGIAIADQLPNCNPPKEIKEFDRCWVTSWSSVVDRTYYVNIVEGGERVSGLEVIVILPDGVKPASQEDFDTIGKGRISYVAWTRDSSESQDVLSGLIGKRGKPTSYSTEKVQNAFGARVTRITAKWVTTWGAILFRNPSDKLDEFQMLAYTKEWAVLKNAYGRKAQADKKNEF